MRKAWTALLLLLLLCGLATIAHTKADELAAGPIGQRQELMKGIGKNAKAVDDAMKAGNTAPVAAAPRVDAARRTPAKAAEERRPTKAAK
jgi:cytochrome c556